MRSFKLARRVWQGLSALAQMTQAYRAFAWLRDHHDIF